LVSRDDLDFIDLTEDVGWFAFGIFQTALTNLLVHMVQAQKAITFWETTTGSPWMPDPLDFPAWVGKAPAFRMDHATGDTIQGECMGYSVSQEKQVMSNLHGKCRKQECTYLEYFHRMRIPVLDYLLAVYAADMNSKVISVEGILEPTQFALVHNYGAAYAEQRTFEYLEKLVSWTWDPMLLRNIDVLLNYTMIGQLVRKGLIQ